MSGENGTMFSFHFYYFEVSLNGKKLLVKKIKLAKTKRQKKSKHLFFIQISKSSIARSLYSVFKISSFILRNLVIPKVTGVKWNHINHRFFQHKTSWYFTSELNHWKWIRRTSE